MGQEPNSSAIVEENDGENTDTYIDNDTNNGQGEEATYDDDGNESTGKSNDERFTEGEPLTFIRVRFPGNAKSQPFLLGKRTFVYGQKVLAMSDRGMTVGYVNSFPYERAFTKSMLPLRTISKAATKEEFEKQNSYALQEKEAASACHRLIEKYRLDMNLTHVEFMQFGKKVVFYFNAPARVDFRDLVKELVGILKMRVELRQISVRDRTAAIGAIGACGLQTCCSSFLKNYGHVSIKMAKNQNLALIPSKINGVCGQIKCCIKYEDDVYTDKRSLLPREGDFIQTKNGDRGRVDRLHIFIEQFEMLTDRGERRKYARGQFDPELKLPADWRFPDRFEHITNENSTVIGLQEEEKLQALRYQQMWEEEGDDEDEDTDGEDQDDSDSDDENTAQDANDEDDSSAQDDESNDNDEDEDEEASDDATPTQNPRNSSERPAEQASTRQESDGTKRPRARRNRRRRKGPNPNAKREGGDKT